MDGLGWIPVDVTPGFYYDTYALLQMAQVPGDIQRTAARKWMPRIPCTPENVRTPRSSTG